MVFACNLSGETVFYRASLATHKIIEENRVFSTIQFVVKRILFGETVPALIVIALTLFQVGSDFKGGFGNGDYWKD
jgi:hypothetical protein